MFVWENRDEKLNFMSCPFDETMTTLILHFFLFKEKYNMFKTNHFPTACFSDSFVQGDIQMAYG